MVTDSVPGSRTTEGKFGVLMESGKCWVSRQKPSLLAYVAPALPSVPSIQFAEYSCAHAEYATTRHNSKAMTVSMDMECGDVVACPFTCTPGALV